MDFKNLGTAEVQADHITNMKIVYGEKYTYQTITGVEEGGGTNFNYSDQVAVQPLKTSVIHYLATVPLEVEKGTEAIYAEFTIGRQEYKFQVR